jgi:ribokinase
MNKVLVSGLINIETTLRVEAFPIPYSPVRYPFSGVDSTVSGVGYNVAKALATLGDDVNFLSIIGRDFAGKLVMESLARDGLSAEFVVPGIERTPQSVILYDGGGRRQINVDLKDIQEQTYPEALFDAALGECALTALCNINFSRPFLAKARRAGKLVATDVHAISDLNDDYNRDFMQAAHILFMSDEHLPESPEVWVRQLLNRYGPEVVVVGLGAKGALLAVQRDNFVERLPAVRTRPIVNTIGAGDALFSCFVHGYSRTRDPYESLRKAMLFASWKVGATGAAEGFLDDAALERLAAEGAGGSCCRRSSVNEWGTE